MIVEYLFTHPRILILLLAAIVIAGINSLIATPRLEDPVLGQRVGVVSVVFPGAEVTQVESLIATPIEELLNHTAEIKLVRSNSRSGSANIVIELQDDVVEVDRVWAGIQNELDTFRPNLPQSAFDPVLEVFPLRAFATIVAVKTKPPGKTDLAVLERIASRLRGEVLSIHGTETVSVFGDSGEEFVVEIQPETLVAMGLSNAAIAGQLASGLSLQPSGNVGGPGGDRMVGINSTIGPINKIGQTEIQFGRGATVPLAKIATIEKRSTEPAKNVALIDRQRAIVLGVLVDNEQQIDRWFFQFENVVAQLQRQFNNEVEFEIVFSQATHVRNRMITLAKNLGIGSAAVALVVLILMGWRSMLVVALALPLSALIVVSGMRCLAIPIHQISVTGLIVALGLLIDNAIVIVDEIRARMIRGDQRLSATINAVRHLQMPLFGSTLTTVLAFWPIATLPGPSGEFVGTLAISVILAISASFVLAMTLIPTAYGVLQADGVESGNSYGLSVPWLRSLYESSLRFTFRFPIVGVMLGMILPIAGFVMSPSLPLQFFPPSDRNQIQIEVELPARQGLLSTEANVAGIYQTVASNPAVLKQHWFVGQSAPTFFYNVVPRKRGTPFYAQAMVDLRANVSTTTIVRELQTAIDQQNFSSRAIVRLLEQGPPFDAPIEIRVVGFDLEVLEQLGNQVRKILSETAQVIHTRSDLGDTSLKLDLTLDTRAMAQHGLSESQVMRQIYTSLEGAPAGKMIDESGVDLPIVVKLAFGEESRWSLLKALPFISPTRTPPPVGARGDSGPPATAPPKLDNLAEVDLKSGSGAIVHVNGRRVNEVKAYIQAGVLPSVVLAEFKERLAAANFELPTGYELQFGGEAEQRNDAVNSLIANGVFLFALMLISLVASFRSFRCALIIAIVGGLSVGLAPLALWLFEYPFGFMAIVGTMGLVGVAINDSIVVLAAIRANDVSPRSMQLSLAQVVSSCTRHVLATTLTTIAGFLPLILSGGGFWPPLALTIAGGVGGATLLALYVVPALYSLLINRENEVNQAASP